MPGFYGWISNGDPARDDRFAAEVAAARPAPVEMKIGAGAVRLGLEERRHGPAAGSVAGIDGGFWALWGHCFDPRSGARLDAAALGALWDAEGETVLDRLEGAFHVVRHEPQAHRLTVLNDRVGILPMYWHAVPGGFSFAPRLGQLARDERAWTPALGPVACFLSVGHFLGPSTQVDEARLLTPATILEVDTRSGEVAERRYWNLVYEPDAGASTAELRRRLGDAIEESTELFDQPSDGRTGIFLSGGWDSRSILGAMVQAGRPPSLVITNGYSDEIPYADTWLAKKMAGDLGIPYRFCRRDPEAGAGAWLHGVHSGEITTANNPESFGLHQLAPEMFAEIDHIMKGDVTWGSGDPAPTRELSIAKIVPYPLMEKVKAVLHGDVAAGVGELYEGEVDGVMRHCTMEDWTDRRDYLWQNGGINRYILGLGISDEEHVQVRRPLLSGRVFAEYTRVPRPLRIQKNLFIETIAARYPRLFSYGRNHAGNIANYYAHMAGFVRERTLAHLDAGHDLDGMLDGAACRRVVEAFRPVETPAWIPGWRARAYDRLHDRFSHRWHRTRFYDVKHQKRFETSDTMLAFHLYLLLEWFHGSPDPDLFARG